MNQTSNSACRVRVHQTNNVRLNIHVEIPISEFYENNMEAAFIDKIAILLGIAINELKVVQVEEGSTILII